jgi:hypothetical protein
VSYRLPWDAPDSALHLVKKADRTVTPLRTSRRTFDRTREYPMAMAITDGRISCRFDAEPLCTCRRQRPRQRPLHRRARTSRRPTHRSAEERPTPHSQRHRVGVPPRHRTGRAQMGASGWNRPRYKARGDRQFGDPHTPFPSRCRILRDQCSGPREGRRRGLFLVPASGAATSDPGTCRLDVTYRHGNTAHNVGTLMLSKTDKSDEHALLECHGTLTTR